MAIDVMDGYRPNRWARLVKQSRPLHGVARYQTISNVGQVSQVQVSVIKADAPSKPSTSSVKDTKILVHLPSPAQYQSLEQGEYPTDINAMKRLGNFVDVYV